MNKLYKYLPFSVKGEVEVPLFEDIEIGELVALKIYKYSISPEEGLYDVLIADVGLVENCLSFKPILRPFEDLNKPIKLSKQTAKFLLHKNEGDEIIPFAEFCRLIVDLNTKLNSYTEDVDPTIQKLENKFTWFGFNLGYIELFDTYIVKGANYIDDVPFDFLRALHFNLDFKECEYIKFED